MVRLLLLILVLANSVYFGWTSGLLRPYGFAPALQNEPQRVAQQINPQSVVVLSKGQLKQVEAQVQADLAPRECLQAGPLEETQLAELRSALENALPADSWQINTKTESARWIVYMGKYPTAAAQAKKRKELAELEFKTYAVNNPALEIGLSLGGFDTKAAANAELAKLVQRGVRTARVVQEREAGEHHWLKLPEVTDALKTRLEDVKPALAGKALRKCD
jgi:hypothetical protein